MKSEHDSLKKVQVVCVCVCVCGEHWTPHRQPLPTTCLLDEVRARQSEEGTGGVVCVLRATLMLLCLRVVCVCVCMYDHFFHILVTYVVVSV